MEGKDFYRAFQNIISITEIKESKKLVDEIGEMTLYYNCIVTPTNPDVYEYKELIENASKLNYLYKYSSLEKPDALNQEDSMLLFTELNKSSVTKGKAEKLSESIASHSFTKFTADTSYTEVSNQQFEAYILHPTRLKNHHGEEFVFQLIKIYENCLIEVNLLVYNKLFVVNEDWTIGIENAQMDQYDYRRGAYINKKPFSGTLEELGRELQTSFIENLLKIKTRQLVDEVEYTEYKIYQCDFIVKESPKIREKLIKINRSPIFETTSLYNFDGINSKEFNHVNYYTSSNSTVLYTTKSHPFFEAFDETREVNAFYGLYIGFFVSLWPLLIEKHITNKIINFHSDNNNFTKNKYMKFRTQINNFKILKSTVINPSHRTVLTLMSDLEESINPTQEKNLVIDYLNDINEYIKISIEQDDDIDNRRIQLILLVLTLITAISVVIELPLPTEMSILITILLIIGTIFLTKR